MSRLEFSRTMAAGGLVLVALMHAGCAGESDRTPALHGRIEVSSTRGPVTLTVSAFPATVTVGEPLQFTIEVVAAVGVDVVMPVLDKDFGTFEVRAAQTPPDVPVPEGRRWRHTFMVDSFAAGKNELPAVTVTFVDGRPESATPAGPIEGELTSDPLPVTVRSVLAADQGELELRDIRTEVRDFVHGPMAGLWPAALAVLLGLTVAVLAVLISRRRRRGDAVQPVITADEWARARLDELQRAGLVEHGRVHEFYVRLSDIVRQYLERRFDLMAPERTTEEFLREARAGTVLGDEHKDLLTGFLRAADLVKFALHEPSVSESGLALTAARRFVEETVPAPPGADPEQVMEDAA